VKQPATKAASFTRQEARCFQIYALLIAAIGAGMFVAAPKGLGQVVGVLFSVLLLPVPPFAIYLIRRRKPTNRTRG
jgi:uncharacterized membrane protein YbhN (UPF0104 family)